MTDRPTTIELGYRNGDRIVYDVDEFVRRAGFHLLDRLSYVWRMLDSDGRNELADLMQSDEKNPDLRSSAVVIVELILATASNELLDEASWK
jgi:hypothetical protein